MTADRLVSERIAALCLGHAGHLPDTVYLAMAVRGAAVVAIATAVHVGGPPGSTRADVLPRTEPVDWVVQLVTDFIDEARARGIAVSSASQAALWSGSMPY